MNGVSRCFWRWAGRRGAQGWFFTSLLVFSLLAPCVADAGEATPDTCTYSTYKWNVNMRKAVDFERVRHPYSELTEDEVDPATGCTVCEEDQVVIELPDLEPFRVCRKLAPDFRRALDEIRDVREPVYSVTGYRVGKTRGEPDGEGNRTGFSNHSFGIAIDINAGQNGLYNRCVEFGPGCRLIMGGEWIPGKPGSHGAGGVVVKAMKAAGFKWGGEIAGRQKDFMHFSPTGY